MNGLRLTEEEFKVHPEVLWVKQSIVQAKMEVNIAVADLGNRRFRCPLEVPAMEQRVTVAKRLLADVELVLKELYSKYVLGVDIEKKASEPGCTNRIGI